MSSEKLNATRNRILEAAQRILEGEDPGKSRMNDIAKAAGISRQALYLHFPSRSELLVATARHLDAVHDVDAQLAASRAAQSGVERLDAFIEAFGNHIPKVWGVARAFMAMMDSDEAARDAWHDRMQGVRHGCAAAVANLERDGQLADHWTHDQATDWLWMLLSMRNWELLVRECGWSQGDYITQMQRSAREVLIG
ncbi:TetR/AcrR family transcriptional regulator [Erythrobacter aurantius]|uniref:TetR/AcrR family transcriptional regulator n=1 Tax=Erythrobacter aurantius TaxID=2909249 RepID=UPI00207A0F52|nr:TetR/AcrR family transcriptional regulator [Erythrobacter aurantius]